MWVHVKNKKHSENITSSVSKYVSRTELPKSPTLGLLLFAIFISDLDDRTQTTFIKLTNNQLGGTANYTEGQKDKLEKGLSKKMKGKALHISRSSQLENNRAANDWLRRNFIWTETGCVQLTNSSKLAVQYCWSANPVLEHTNVSTTCLQHS